MEFRPVPVGIEVVEGVLTMTSTLPFCTSRCMILFGPRTFNAFPTRHTRVFGIRERAIELALFTMAVYMQLRNSSSNPRENWDQMGKALFHAHVEVDRILAPDVVGYHDPTLM
jgi:hypothetical protein